MQQLSRCGRSGRGLGPAITHISDRFPPDQLTALLKEPNAKMKAGGMVPLTLNADDMTALVSYVSSLGGTSAASATTLRRPHPRRRGRRHPARRDEASATIRTVERASCNSGIICIYRQQKPQ